MVPSSEVGLAVLATIRKYTDEEHKLSLNQVASIIFEDYGFTVDPKSLTRYVKLIHKYGFEIDAYIFQKREVYVKNVSFLAEEAYIICFSLLHNDYLSETQKRGLIRKIFGKLNVHQQNEFMSRFESSEDRRLIELFLSPDPAETKAEDYIGKKRIMRSGKTATIVGYRNDDDIDVLFEDGTIIHNRKYNDFLEGKITPYKRLIDCQSKRLNETRLMNNGQSATIISYKSTNNIDVKFEDGTIVRNKRYTAFQTGVIQNPNKLIIKKQAERINETRLMNNGQRATIISYKSTNNIDVKFEDGTIVKKRSYKDFRKGYIQNPNNFITKYHLERINETRLMRNGQRATIISYKSTNNIDVKFEDGTIVKKKRYKSFQNGTIQNPNKKGR